MSFILLPSSIAVYKTSLSNISFIIGIVFVATSIFKPCGKHRLVEFLINISSCILAI